MGGASRSKAAFERAVRNDRFSERKLFADTAEFRAAPAAAAAWESLANLLPGAQVEVAQRRLMRAALLIELVNKSITSTKYDVRWTKGLPETDPRKASFEECQAIFQSLCCQVVRWLPDPGFREQVKLFVPWGLSPHEIPVDYRSKVSKPIHTEGNLTVLVDPGYLRLLRIRRALLDPDLNPDFQLFGAIFDKVRVKSYLTDRALTGDYKTNREKRWEAHPDSPQAALRRDCFAVELALIEQLLRFKAFPPGVIQYLQSEGLIADLGKVARCPVTLDPLDFEVLAQEVMDPTHGKAAYQVGHLNPLKAGASEEFRHSPANISWITEDGNRIQGHLTLKETRDLLFRISKNYEALARGELS